jgi:hypothetical protein
LTDLDTVRAFEEAMDTTSWINSTNIKALIAQGKMAGGVDSTEVSVALEKTFLKVGLTL